MKSADDITDELLKEHGPFVPIAKAWKLLSYVSLDAARKASQRGTTPIPCMQLEGRRGRFVLASDLGAWVACALRSSATTNQQRGGQHADTMIARKI